MSRDPHARARDLVARFHVEGLSAGDSVWLDRHVADCSACREVAESTNRALQSVRAFSVPFPPELAARASRRIYWHTERQQQNRRSQWAVWGACAVSWVGGAASSPYVLRGFQWVGHEAGLPDPVWKMGFVLWWGVPALLAAAALLMDPSALQTTRRRE